MTQQHQLEKESSPTIRSYSDVPQTISCGKSKLYLFEAYSDSTQYALANYAPIESVVENWSRDAKRKAALDEARLWMAGVIGGTQQEETIKTLRLKKGLSQQQLADMISTSQSHVARIEKGNDNITIQTLRKLRDVLGVDLSTLDKAIDIQEKRLAERVKKQNDSASR